MKKTSILSEVARIRVLSERCWEAASEDPREDGDAEDFIEAWDAWGSNWDAAESALEEGRLAEALESLSLAKTLEGYYGSDEHARAAIAAVAKG